MSQTSFDLNKLSNKLNGKNVDKSEDNNQNSEDKTHVLSVSQLNQSIKGVLEDCFENFWLKGEVSNFKAHTSGHWYFSVKDNKSQVNAVMFRGQNSRLKFRPETGMEVLIRGRVSVYEPRGNYQVYCEYIEPAGVGALQQAFEQLKIKLKNEGLFNKEHKKPIPTMPLHIAVITSPTGAAVRDIINVISRRYRSAQVTIIPALVQGEKAAADIVKGLQVAEKIKDLDVIILGRGGGSMEDMWCFNEESVARAIYACSVPIISAVGHEVDFTISDFVSDMRAPTPSAAAELVAKNANELIEKLISTERRLAHMISAKIKQVQGTFLQLNKRLIDPRRRLEDLAQKMDDLNSRLDHAMKNNLKQKHLQVQVLRQKLIDPSKVLEALLQKLENFKMRLKNKMYDQISSRKYKWQRLSSLLDSVSPLSVVDRGYSMTLHNKKIVKSIKQLTVGESIVTRITDGEVVSEVKQINEVKNGFRKKDN